MEVFLASVAHAATELDIVEALERVLHPPHGLSSVPVNFSVNVFTNRNKKTNRLSTNANVTIADASVAQRFLAEYGHPHKSLVIRGRAPLCLPSKRAADPARLQQLKTNPHVSPATERSRQAELARLKEPIAITSLEFGRLVQEQPGGLSFGSAYKRTFSGGALSFDAEKRILVISCGDFDRLVLIPLYSISALQEPPFSTTYPPRILLTLKHAPIYLSSGSLVSASGSSLNDELDFAALLSYVTLQSGSIFPKPKQRLSALDDEHGQVAPYCQHHLMLTFPGSAELDQFKHRRSDAFRLPRITQIRLKTKPSTLGSDLRLLELKFKRLDIRVAFQLELLVRNAILTPDQVLELVPSVTALETQAGPDQAERCLSRFASRLVKALSERWASDEGGWYEEDEDDYLSAAASTAHPFSRLDGKQTVTPSVSVGELVALLEHLAKTTPRLSIAGLDETLRLHYGRHVVLTSTGVRLEGPLPDESNALLRRFPQHLHHFLRVSIRDDDMEKVSHNRDVDVEQFLKSRFRPFFVQGLSIAGRTFEFLGFSQSALKEHSTWFVAPFVEGGRTVSAGSIRKSLGDFSKVIYIPARYMARLAQNFTATQPALVLIRDQIRQIPDIESDSESCFTDGVGTISSELADEIDRVLKAARPDGRRKNRVKSTCYQFRLGGAKGMLVIDPLLRGKVVCLRPSQTKYASESLSLDIAGTFERPLACYLNRPLIKILEDLGVQQSTLLDLQAEAVTAINCARSSLSDAGRMFDQVGFGTTSRASSMLHALSRYLDKPAGQVDPFLNAAVDVAVAVTLRGLKFKARIPVKGSYTLVGVADEDGYVQEGEIYACIKEKGKKTIYLKGDVCISRSPSIHPGDVQVVRAVGALPVGVAPRLRALHNCVVFSTRGARALPSCLGGGDLDGDLYSCITLESLMPTRTAEPAAYPPPQMKKTLYPATIEDGVDFFLEYILADIMGTVANRHLQLADYYLEGSLHPDCLTLAELHSTAVDYPKTGQPVRIKSLPITPSKLKPNFMAGEYWAHQKGNEKRFYTSDKALGQLFRAIPLKDTQPKPWQHDDDTLDPSRTITTALAAASLCSSSLPQLPTRSPSKLKQEMRHLLVAFLPEIGYIASTHTLSKRPDRYLSEVEVYLSAIAAPAKQPRQRQDLVARLQLATSELFDRFCDEISGWYGEEELELEEQVKRACAAWQVALEAGEEYGVKTFGFLSLQLLLDGLKRLEGEED
ncbi:hypothetical protein JCM11641_001935 [Rhodosporidiobolus odoratus]